MNVKYGGTWIKSYLKPASQQQSEYLSNIRLVTTVKFRKKTVIFNTNRYQIGFVRCKNICTGKEHKENWKSNHFFIQQQQTHSAHKGPLCCEFYFPNFKHILSSLPICCLIHELFDRRCCFQPASQWFTIRLYLVSVGCTPLATQLCCQKLLHRVCNSVWGGTHPRDGISNTFIRGPSNLVVSHVSLCDKEQEERDEAEPAENTSCVWLIR